MRLYPHQEKALRDTEGNGNALYALDMGLGKTYVGSEKMMRIGNRVNLVVCQKSKIDDWIEHFEIHYRIPQRGSTMVYDCSKWKKVDWVYFAEDPGFENDRHGQEITVMVINYDLLFRRRELLKLRDFTLMLDESSLIQNETTERAKFILAMQYKNVILLSGTVVNGNYEKLWSQCNLLGWRIPKRLFYRHYTETETVEMDGFKRSVIRGYRNVDRLKRKMREYGSVFLRTDEVMDLPTQNDIFVYVEPTEEYREFCKHPIITIGEKELVGDFQLTERMYRKMLCAQYSEPKLRAFRDIVDSTDDRLVVFYTYTGELRAMLDICCDRTWSIVNGDTKDLEFYDSDPQSITFVQYQAGAMGLNLQKANKIVYYSLPEGWSEGFEQSRKRIHRIGQDRPCFYYILLTRNSIEEEIWDRLGEKKERTDVLFDEKEE